MTASRIGFWIGLAGFAVTLLVPAPGTMAPQAWTVAGLTWWMAAWWMTGGGSSAGKQRGAIERSMPGETPCPCLPGKAMKPHDIGPSAHQDL